MLPPLIDRVHHSTLFSTINRRVLTFTKHTMFVHKICDFKSLTALQSLQGGLDGVSAWSIRDPR